MNKLLKGSIAGAAGVALLLGSGGTFALWSSSAVVAGGPVASGTLTVKANGVPVWRDVSPDRLPTYIPSISTFRMVPGDTVELKQDLTVTATGDNLRATLSYDDATVVAYGTQGDALKAALVFAVDANGGANVTRVGATNTFSVTPSATASTVTVTVTITLPSSVGGTIAQAGTVDLSGLAFKLEQAPRP